MRANDKGEGSSSQMRVVKTEQRGAQTGHIALNPVSAVRLKRRVEHGSG